MEEAILKAEGDVERIEGLFAAPDFHEKYASRTKELQEELETAKTRATKLFARWEELEGIAKQAK